MSSGNPWREGGRLVDDRCPCRPTSLPPSAVPPRFSLRILVDSPPVLAAVLVDDYNIVLQTLRCARFEMFVEKLFLGVSFMKIKRNAHMTIYASGLSISRGGVSLFLSISLSSERRSLLGARVW